ncbi:hypothetical protein ES707_17717 [subsurface metagenome]
MGSDPTTKRVICGDIRQTHPMIPVTETMDAVATDARMMMSSRSFSTLIPSDLASSSPIESVKILHRKMSRPTMPRSASGTETATSPQVMTLSLPMIHATMVCVFSGSTRIWTNDNKPEKRAETITPPSTSDIGDNCPRNLETSRVRNIPPSPNMIADG